jgi:hypothetical protein
MIHTHRTISEIFSPQTSLGRGIKISGDLFNKNKEAVHEVFYDDEFTDNEIPLAIIPENGNLEDFFADIFTFHPDLTPLTALCHVTEAPLIKSLSPKKTINQNRAINAFIGSSFTEVILRLAKNGSNQAPTFSACRKSLSFILARSDILYPSMPLLHTYGKWQYANEILNTHGDPEISDAVYRMSEIVLGHAGWPARPKGRESIALKSLSSFISDKSAEHNFINALYSIYENIGDISAFQSGPFDGRMAIFDHIVSTISRSSGNKEIDGIAVGYFANLINPGSFSHYPILLRHINRYPTALIWYGFFSGLDMGRTSPEMLTGISRKLRRDLEEPFSFNGRPQADTSIDELAVLLRMPRLINTLKPNAQKSLRVTLIPGIDIFSKFPEEQEKPGSDENELRLFEISSRQLRVREIMIQALRSLDGSIEFLENQKKAITRHSRR